MYEVAVLQLALLVGHLTIAQVASQRFMDGIPHNLSSL